MSFFKKNSDLLAEHGHEPQFIAIDAVGYWIVWEVLGRAPETEEERSLVRTIGGFVTHKFFDWWTTPV
jgi:hypothetical protein